MFTSNVFLVFIKMIAWLLHIFMISHSSNTVTLLTMVHQQSRPFRKQRDANGSLCVRGRLSQPNSQHDTHSKVHARNLTRSLQMKIHHCVLLCSALSHLTAQQHFGSIGKALHRYSPTAVTKRCLLTQPPTLIDMDRLSTEKYKDKARKSP